VRKFEALYGRKQISYNVHGLIHLPGDVKNLGPLDDFSGFKFENYLGFIKKLLKKPNSPLQQVHRRLFEYQNLQCELPIAKQNQTYLRMHSNGPTVNGNAKAQFKSVSFGGYLIKTDLANNTCMLKNRKVIQIFNIVKKDDIGFIVGKPFSNLRSLFTSPCDSMLLNIYTANYPKVEECYEEYPITTIDKKCIVLPISLSECAILPLLHSD
jgi:hypothetical protein